MHYTPSAAANTTPPTPVRLQTQALSTPLVAVLDGEALAAALLADDGALVVDDPLEPAEAAEDERLEVEEAGIDVDIELDMDDEED